MKIGFFGGSFNPLSYIHINLAKEIIDYFKLDKVFFVPVGDYYKKDGLIKAIDRCNMIKLAIEDEEKVGIDTLAAESKEKLCAVDTFKLIKEKYKKEECFFIMGSDNFRNMSKWKNYEELINNYDIIVIERERKQIRKTNKNNIHEYIPEKLQEIDSSKIREKFKNNENIEKLVHPKVIDYITQHGLYK